MTHGNKIPKISVLFDRGIRNIILEEASYPVDYILKINKIITHEKSATLHLNIV